MAFTVYKRAGGSYYVQFRDPKTGRRLSPRSLGTQDEREALTRAAQWEIQGVPAAGLVRTVEETATAEAVLKGLREAPLTHADAAAALRILRARGLLAPPASSQRDAREFLTGFWEYETSEYIAERIAHGLKLTKRHAKDMLSRARQASEHLPPGVHLHEVTRTMLEAVGKALRAQGLAAASINKTMTAIKAPLKWAAEHELISADPGAGVRGFGSAPVRRRGILEPNEARELFALEWADRRARVACLISATSGLRLGEVLALRHKDIGERALYVRHSWSATDGLKTTKTGRERTVPLLGAVRDEILALEAESPHPEAKGPDRFIFAGRTPERPLDANRILAGFRAALVELNGGASDPKTIKEKERRDAILAEYKARGVDFHAWRHFYSKHLAARVDRALAQKATGHATPAMIEHYAAHQDEADLRALESAAADAFAWATKAKGVAK